MRGFILSSCLLGAALTGCVHAGADRESLAAKNTWVGKPVDELVRTFGYPARKHTSPRGLEVYEYVERSSQPSRSLSAISFSSLQQADGEVTTNECVRWFELKDNKVIEATMKGC